MSTCTTTERLPVRRIRAVARILRTGKRSVVVQVDIYRANDDQIGATATVNFAAVD